MSYAQERIDIEARLNTGWATTSIDFGNGPFVPTPGTAWIRCTILPGDAAVLAFGRSADKEYSGIIDIGIFVPRLTGTALARTYADTLAALFDEQVFGSVDCDEASIQNIGPEEDWYHFAVTIPFSRIE